MSEERLRRLERQATSGDPQARARLLHEQLRIGAVSRERVLLAAGAGDEAALGALAPEERLSPGKLVRLAWEKIEGWLAVHAPGTLATLNPGASESALQGAESQLGRPLPEAVRVAWSIHDGQSGARGLRDHVSLNDLNHALYNWESGLPNFQHKPSFVQEVPSDREQHIRRVVRSSGWVPISSSLCLDLDPGEAGRVGQLFSTSGPRVVATGFEVWLASFANSLELGEYERDEQGDVVRAPVRPSFRAARGLDGGDALLARVKSGELPKRRVELAAWLGHQAACAALGQESADFQFERWARALAPWGYEVYVRGAVAACRRALDLREDPLPDPNLGREALATVEDWLARPSKESAAALRLKSETTRRLVYAPAGPYPEGTAAGDLGRLVGELLGRAIPHGWNAWQRYPAETCRRLLDLALDGANAAETLETLRAEGLPTTKGGPWRKPTVKRLLATLSEAGERGGLFSHLLLSAAKQALSQTSKDPESEIRDAIRTELVPWLLG